MRSIKVAIRILCALLLTFSGICSQGQTHYPSEETQQKMLTEQCAFLANMKPGLQHTQMLAVRAAMKGDDAALMQIRQSRNQAPTLPDGITATFPTSDICLFTPTKPATGKRKLLLYLHGGGWCFGSINSCARFCASLALEADCCVAALNYRLAPSHPFPAPLTDCQQAFAYLKRHAEELGCDSTQVSIGGDSAGGNLALATALSVPGVCKVIPIYPVTKLFTEPSASWLTYSKGYGNDAELLEAFNEAYATTETHNPLVSVGLASDSAHHLCWSRHFIRPNSRTGTKTATPQPPTPLSCVPHSHTSFHHSSRPAHRFPRSCKSHRLIPHHPIADSCPESRLYSISLLRNTLSQQIGTGR